MLSESPQCHGRCRSFGPARGVSESSYTSKESAKEHVPILSPCVLPASAMPLLLRTEGSTAAERSRRSAVCRPSLQALVPVASGRGVSAASLQSKKLHRRYVISLGQHDICAHT